MKRIWLFRSPEAGSGAGGGGFVGISDIIGGDGSEKVTKLDEVIQTTDEGLNEDGSLKEGYIKDAEGKVVKAPAPAPGTVEGVNADGSLQEGYIKDAQGNVIKDPAAAAAEEEEESTEDEGNFWDAVSKITGREFKIEYPEGVDPTTPEGQAWLTTPEGVAHVVGAEREAAAVEFEEYLKEKNPRGYAFLMHLEAGGKEEDFFADNRGYTLPTQEELAASADLQANLYKYDLLNRGLDEDAAQALVDKAIKDNKLKDKADASWKWIDGAQKEQLALLQKDKADRDTAFNNAVASITQTVEKQIKEGLGFVVPETQQAEFRQYVINNLRYDNGKFFVVQEVGQDPKTLLESLFFQYKKGDLKQLVERQSKTKAAQSLRLKLGKNNPGPGTGGGTGGSASKHVPLSAILPVTGN